MSSSSSSRRSNGTIGRTILQTLAALSAFITEINQKNIPTLIQEQNSYAGITNKLLSKKVNTICVAYEGMEKFFPKEKIVFTGNPVRQDINNIENKHYCIYLN